MPPPPACARRLDELRGLPCDFMYTPEGLGLMDRLGRSALLLDRFGQLAVLAAREAGADAGLDPASGTAAAMRS